MKINALREMTAKNGTGMLADGQGLWLIKDTKNRGKWILRLFVGGKRREMGLGRWPDVGLAEAREKAGDARKLSRAQIDPIETRKQSSRVVERMTLKQAIESGFQARKAELKGDGEAGRWMSPLRVHIIPKIGKKPVEAIDQHVLKEVLGPIWHTKPEAAEKALNRIGLMLKHAAALGLNVDLQATMKARALLGKQRHETTHIPYLPYEDAPAFYKWLCKRDDVSSRALRFLMLTLGRTTEVRLAEGEEFAGTIWTLPAGRTKSNIERRIPLVDEAVKLTVKTGFLFPAYKGKPISDMAMSTMMKREGYTARPHGFRSTFRTWAEECTDADYETKEACLGHVVDTGVQAAYQRSDRLEKRRTLLKEWAAFLLR